MRRLPVYLLLDCSESMIGDGIESVTKGVATLLQELRKSPEALDAAHISVITFDGQARQLAPLSDLMDFKAPQLVVRPGTALGAGLRLLSESINREVQTTTATRKGDFRPLVFILTDGQPTDDWRSVIATLDGFSKPRIANIYAIGCGEDVDYHMLEQVSDIVLKLPQMDAEAIRKLFIWLSASVQSASIAVTKSGQSGINLDKLPEDVERVEKGSHRPPDGQARQVFIRGYCGADPEGSLRPYLMRFKFVEGNAYGQPSYYEPVRSHKLSPENLESAGGFKLPPVNSSQLNGPAPCAWCGNTAAAQCPCGTTYCVPTPMPRETVCPTCKRTLTFQPGVSGSFDVGQSAG